MNTFFHLEERADSSYCIKVNTNKVPTSGARGSLNVLAARVCGISYAKYLILCRDTYNGMIIGKIGYPYVIFKDKKKATELLKVLNSRAEKLI